MQIDYVNVFVSDLDQAVDFYQEKLGLVLQSSEPQSGYASFAAGPVRLGIAVADDTQQALIGRHTGIGFSVKNLQQDYERLAALGVTFLMLPTKQSWGGFMAMFNDPDGNHFYLDQIEVMHPLE
ncbi:VOC family protein [Pseudomonadales bacterium]|nr:VOC family protein [Pseudomonadales bacterium]MDB4068459.1 VOC family protein [Pseudomonadales bacterium]MDB9878994.1 VOC family protein [Pseudomonadales bacterium]MDB9942325.1 VOC family protein [Pseudomonadales bacterium]MDC1306572.1 VOC family protein [Pseudomonadales bacterium]